MSARVSARDPAPATRQRSEQGLGDLRSGHGQRNERLPTSAPPAIGECYGPRVITALKCRNYRSLENVEVAASRLTAMVGPNGTGKTSILRALGLVLGDTWPSMRSIRVPYDFTRFDTALELGIEVRFDPPLKHVDALGKAYDVPGLRYECKPYKRKTKSSEAGDLHYEFDPVGETGEAPMVAVGWKADKRPDFRPLRVSNDLREQARVLVVDHRRSVLQHLPSTRGSALGRLFNSARRELDAVENGASPRERFAEAYSRAMEAIRTPRVQEVEQTIEETAKRMAGFLGSSTLKQVDIGFGFADPANPLNSLRLVYRESGLEIPAEELGLGIQSALVVGIFDALRRLGGPVGTLVIEEPEMYLHPQAQRYFYRLLCEMADSGECQVIYSTHSPIFADVTRFDSIRLVRKEPGEMSTVSMVTEADDAKYLTSQSQAQKFVAFDSTRSEMLFARRALIVEGQSDRLAVLSAAERMGHDPDAEDLAIIPCGSKSNIPFFVRVCRALRVPFVVLHDSDVHALEGSPEKRERIAVENVRAKKGNQDILNAAGDESRIFVVTPTLDDVLGISRRTPDKPRRVIQALEKKPLADIPEVLRQAVSALFEEDQITNS